MAGDALIQAILSKDAKGGGQTALEVLAFFVLVVELQRLWKATRFREVVAEFFLLAARRLVGVDGGSHGVRSFACERIIMLVRGCLASNCERNSSRWQNSKSKH